MSQIDQLIYLPLLIWFIIFAFIFYIIIYTFIIPSLYWILFIRSKFWKIIKINNKNLLFILLTINKVKN